LYIQTEVLRRLHNEEIYDLYCSTETIIVIKSRDMKWTETRNSHKVLVRKPEGKRQLVDIDKDGRIVLNVCFNKKEIL
jgi:hypothetical protein